jgi:hypothetical protein
MHNGKGRLRRKQRLPSLLAASFVWLHAFAMVSVQRAWAPSHSGLIFLLAITLPQWIAGRLLLRARTFDPKYRFWLEQLDPIFNFRTKFWLGKTSDVEDKDQVNGHNLNGGNLVLYSYLFTTGKL